MGCTGGTATNCTRCAIAGIFWDDKLVCLFFIFLIFLFVFNNFNDFLKK